MTDVRLRYIHEFIDRHGKPRYYFRHRGQQWSLPPPGDPGFMAAYEACKTAIAAGVLQPKVSFLPGTLGWAIERFTATDEYKARPAKSRANLRQVFDELRRRYGAGLLNDLTARHVKIIRDAIRADFAASTADKAISAISIVWEYAGEHLDLDLSANPTTGIRRVFRRSSDGHKPWPKEVIERFEAGAAPSLKLALHLLLYTGQRRSDVVSMKWSQFDGEVIEVRQQKTGEPLTIPCHSALRATLKATARSSDFILVGRRGRYSGDGLAGEFRRRLHGLGVNGYTVHGLRKNAGVALADAGCDAREIMAILGHRSYAMVMHYTKRADQRRRAQSAMQKWEKSGKPKNVAGSK